MPGLKQLDLFTPDQIPLDTVLDNLGTGDEARVWPAFLIELVDVVTDFLESRRGLDTDTAHTMAQGIIVSIAHYLGGKAVYLPRDDKLKLAIRDALIYREFDGSNHRDLAKKTGLTTTQIYNIIARQRRIRMDKIQPELPFGER